MSLWARITKPFKSAAEKRNEELMEMSPAERAYAEEPVEDHAADEAAEEHLGGFDSDELTEDD
jgi:hypothetical protein